jgi:hypothetical protein
MGRKNIRIRAFTVALITLTIIIRLAIFYTVTVPYYLKGKDCSSQKKVKNKNKIEISKIGNRN